MSSVLRFVKIILFLIFSLIVLSVQASDVYPFQSKSKRQEFNYLISEFRCLVCQNESLAASYAPLAVDLRRQIYQQVKQGESSRAIQSYLVARYGDFILFKPPVNKDTYLLWFSPALLFLLGLLIFFRIGYQQKKRRRQINSKMDSIDQQKLEDVLR